MKKFLFLFLLSPFVFSSCSSTYFYSKVDSSSLYSQKIENGDFVFENDSLWIAYCFKGEGAPIQITVYNKMGEPLYVDWQRSALIINDQAISYMGDVLEQDVVSDSNCNIDGSVRSLPKEVSFIPPRTKVSNTTLRLAVGFENIDKKMYRNILFGLGDGNVLKVKGIRFDREDTPLRFASYLTLYTEDKKRMVYEQDFYISTLLKTTIPPNELHQSMCERGDMFFTVKPADNRVWNVLLGTTIIAGAVVIDIAVGDQYY